MTRLSNSSLKTMTGRVSGPTYDRSALKAGILHFGVGNFHRSHQAVYLDALFNSGLDHDWAVVGAGIFSGAMTSWQRLREQDWLTTVVQQEGDDSSARVIGVMLDYLTPGDWSAIVEKLSDPSIRIVSLTITEGGYFIDAPTGKFNSNRPEIVADAQNQDHPKTVFGLILAGLKVRRRAGVEPFTIMSCDNIPYNGRVTANALIGLAALNDPQLAIWIKDNIAFPNGMVDRITPATTDSHREQLKKEFGIEDAWPVFCEPFKQWVLEDHFPAGRPALEKVGVQFVADVSPFELMKIRILNGGHAAIAYPAALLDIQFVHEAMEQPLVSAFLGKLEREEIIPTVPQVPGTDLPHYYRTIENRFSNRSIADTIDRLCFDGSNRQPKFIVPTAADSIRISGRASGLALVSALWCRYCHGDTDSGRPIAANDSIWDRLRSTARAAKENPASWLSMSDIYGALGTNPAFARDFASHLASLWRQGTAATLQDYISREQEEGMRS
jgi:mannitol 2-dehydrogenase